MNFPERYFLTQPHLLLIAQPSNLVLEMLREKRDQHRKTHSELAEIKHHVLALRESLAPLAREEAHIYQPLSDRGSRLNRIEERLAIKD